jgi:hypothetical protein
MNQKKDLDNTQILPIEEEEVNGNSFLVIGGERFKIDGGTSILINRNMPPRVTLEELSEHIGYAKIQTGIEPYEAEDMEEMDWLYWTSVHFKDADHAELIVDGEIGWDHVLSCVDAGAYVEMLELSAEKQPEFGKSVSFKSDYDPMYGSSFTLKVQVNAKTLDDAVAAGMKVIDEIFKPVRDSEKFVKDKLDELEASQKKS